MKQALKTVVFADLIGSTGLFESVGNVAATRIVTRSTQTLAQALTLAGGELVKYLGDGVLVLFDSNLAAIEAAPRLPELLLEQLPAGLPPGKLPGIKIGIERGVVIEHDADCYGDAVNIAARLSDRAQAGETLIGEAAYLGLSEAYRVMCQSLDRILIKGKAEPIRVWRVDWARSAERTLTASIDLNEYLREPPPQQSIELECLGLTLCFHATGDPVLIGRGEGVGFVIEDTRVSRRHARIEWLGGQCTLTDCSSNGSWVRFANASAPIMLRRESCALYGEGEIGLGAQPDDFTASTLNFRVIDQS